VNSQSESVGSLTLKDLRDYKVIERDAVKSTYSGMSISHLNASMITLELKFPSQPTISYADPDGPGLDPPPPINCQVTIFYISIYICHANLN